MRTLSSLSRALIAGAVLVAALLVLGGAFLVGYVSELQRDLNDPAALRQQAGTQIAAVEAALGYDGFLKIYRNYRLTGDSAARPQLLARAAEADHAIEALRTLYAQSPGATGILREARAIGATFVHVAQTAPEVGEAALRGSASMEALGALPQSPQLESAFLALQASLDRLKRAEQDHQLGSVASALNFSQMLIVGVLGCLVLGLIAVAGLLQMGIIHPLKSLERSLASVGEGNVGQKIWGADRKDEIGELARAGERLRRGLTETATLKAMAENSQLHVSVEGQGSLLFEKLAADVTSATEALKAASADLTKLQTDNRHDLEAALGRLGQASTGVDEAAKAFQRDSANAVSDVQTTAEQILIAAKLRSEQLDQVAARFAESGTQIDDAVQAAKQGTAQAITELVNTTASMKRLTDGAQQIQTAFFASCDKISSDAGNTTTEVRTLAARLNDAVGAVDEKLNQKLAALDRLEQGLNDTLAKLQTGAEDTVAALGRTSGALDEHRAANEARSEKTAAEFEEVVRIFRDDEAALKQSQTDAVAEIRAAQQTIIDAAKGQQAERQSLAEATARLREVADRLAKPSQVSLHPAALNAEFKALSETFRGEVESLRGEIRDMAVRMTEDRILSSAGSPFAEAGAHAPLQSQMRTMADVPGAEIVARLKDLAAEMTATQNRTERTDALKTALGAFAAEVKTLAANADRAARLKAMGKALDHHAGEIESHIGVIDPSAAALRGEVHAITSELRTIAARAQTSGMTKDAPVLRESAVELGARAESLFTYLDGMRQKAPIEDDLGDEDPSETIDQTAADIAALGHLIGKLEARAEHLSQAALSARLQDIPDTLSPAERDASLRQAELRTDGAIHTVFELIERLNNIAANLARAGDVDRQRKAAH